MRRGLAVLATVAVLALTGCYTGETEEFHGESREYDNYDDQPRANNFGPYASAGRVDCDAFPSQYAAQRFYEDNGGPAFDPYYLDGDGDGIACEWR